MYILLYYIVAEMHVDINAEPIPVESGDEGNGTCLRHKAPTHILISYSV